MSKTQTITYDVSLGNATLKLTGLTGVEKLSYHLRGDANLISPVTVKLQETNVDGLGQKDIAGATAIANTNTDEYVGEFNIGGIFTEYDIIVGAALVGIVTLVIKY